MKIILLLLGIICCFALTNCATSKHNNSEYLSDKEWNLVYKENKWFLDSLIKCTYENERKIIQTFRFNKNEETYILIQDVGDYDSLTIDLLNWRSYDSNCPPRSTCIVWGSFSFALLIKEKKLKRIDSWECRSNHCSKELTTRFKSCLANLDSLHYL